MSDRKGGIGLPRSVRANDASGEGSRCDDGSGGGGGNNFLLVSLVFEMEVDPHSGIAASDRMLFDSVGEFWTKREAFLLTGEFGHEVGPLLVDADS